MLSEKSADFCRYVLKDRLNFDAELTAQKLYILIGNDPKHVQKYLFIKAVYLLGGAKYLNVF